MWVHDNACGQSQAGCCGLTLDGLLHDIHEASHVEECELGVGFHRRDDRLRILLVVREAVTAADCQPSAATGKTDASQAVLRALTFVCSGGVGSGC